MKIGVLKYKDIERVMPGRKEFGRLIVMEGPEKGTVFVFESSAEGSFVLGRGDFTDLQLMDSKSSRRHAEFWIEGTVMKVRDLQSSNGVRVDGGKIKGARELRSGDKISLGSSKLEWSYQVELSKMPEMVEKAVKNNLKLKEKQAPLMPTTDQVNFERPLLLEDMKKYRAKKSGGAEVFLVLAVVGGLFLWIDQDDLKSKVKNKKNRVSTRITRKLNNTGSTFFAKSPDRSLGAVISEPPSDPTAEIHLHRGKRELRERNYSRAMIEFAIALSIQPRMPEAMIQLASTRKLLLIEAKELTQLGELQKRGGRYSSAANHFCQVMKLLKSDPDGAVDIVKKADGTIEKGGRFKRTKERYDEVLKRMGMDESKDHCQI